jgi:hypothetical protein
VIELARSIIRADDVRSRLTSGFAQSVGVLIPTRVGRKPNRVTDEARKIIAPGPKARRLFASRNF